MNNEINSYHFKSYTKEDNYNYIFIFFEKYYESL